MRRVWCRVLAPRWCPNWAARLGLPGALSGALAGLHRRRPVHEPGEVLCDLAAMLIDGGDCVSDLGALADQPDLFGQVGSHSTVSRLLHALGEGGREALRAARAKARERAFARAARNASRPPSPRACSSRETVECEPT